MKIIGFDTATDDTVVAASSGGEVVFEKLIGPNEKGRPVHSEMLMVTLNDAAEALGGWADVRRLAVGTGPGTFTGIRIGLATANGLALSAGIDLAAVSTLEALALPMRDGSRPVLPLLDARRGEVFAALYGPDGEILRAPFASGPEDLAPLLAELDPSPIVGGPGAVRFRDELLRIGLNHDDSDATAHHLSGRAICELGAAIDRIDNSTPLEPTYLRVPDAQLWLERDGSTNGP
ncbi:MAG: tRNA (adenosine(37)-N6)-threonylcarbamoyltransferase complex dimerization subunit type 1 TsaB [Solirubrobacterales bacterium]